MKVSTDLKTLIALIAALFAVAGLYYGNRHDIEDLRHRVERLEANKQAIP